MQIWHNRRCGERYSLILLHEDKDHTRNLNGNNSLLFYEAMANLQLAKGDKDAAIRYATVLSKICTSMGGSTKVADDIITKAKS